MFTAIEAERLIFTLVDSIKTVEQLRLDQVSGWGAADCLGRVLAAQIVSPLDFPHWDNSAMDGYALKSSDVQQVPATLQIVEEIPAGKRPTQALKPGQSARIMTGAMMPEGADTVVMQEETERSANGQSVTILQAPKSQSFVRQRGSFARVGDVLLAAGEVIGSAEMALLSAAQQTQIPVFRRPRVAILSTGSELVRPDQPLQPGQIVDSNQYALAALVAQTGAVPVLLGVVEDNRDAVKSVIAAAINPAMHQCDMVLSSGGVSVGDYDYIDDVLAELGATLHIQAVAIKPGKPLTVATLGSKLYFGLPGNPASAMVGFWRFVAGAIAKLSGRVGPWSPEFVWATATMPLTAGGHRETYLWGHLQMGESGYAFSRASGGHSSGNLVNLVRISGLGMVPMGETQIAAGEKVRVLKL